MASKNTVTLTFAGDAAPLSKTFDQVGGDATKMGGKVDKASKDVGSGFDRVAEQADNVDTKAMGFRDTMTGVEDTGRGLASIMKGDLFTGFLTLGMGVGDLASGMFNFLIPMLKNSAIFTKGLAIAQGALNLVMSANPIALVVIALAALVGGFILAWKHSETFRDVVRGAMRAVGDAIEWVLDKLRSLARSIGKLPGMGILGSVVGRLPGFATGGVVGGPVGMPQLAVVHGGETIMPPGRGGGGTTIINNISGVGMGRDFGNAVAQAIRDNRLIGVT